MDDFKKAFIDFMIDSGVLTFGDFTLKSGRRSPYFINTGKYRTGKQLYRLGEFYADCFRQSVNAGEHTLLFGPAYKGIPLVAITASSLWHKYGVDIPYFFNRKEEKDHGEGGSFVGCKPSDGDDVVIIEDVITAGTAVRETVPLLRASAKVGLSDMIISVDRMEKTDSGLTAVREVYNDFGISVHPVVTVAEIREHIDGSLDPALLSRMDAYIGEHCDI